MITNRYFLECQASQFSADLFFYGSEDCRPLKLQEVGNKKSEPTSAY